MENKIKRKGQKSLKALTPREEKRLLWWKTKQEKKEETIDEEKSENQKEAELQPVVKSPEREEEMEEQSHEEAAQNITQEEEEPSNSSETKNKTQEKDDKKKYYILFIGNLPYTASEEDIAKHFQQIGGIQAVRLLTDKTTKKSRGCAYIEFTNARTHKLALMLHHSTLKGRKINVEFTSAGRKSERRTEKLKQKNKVAERFKVGPYFRAKIEKKTLPSTDKHYKGGKRK